MAEVRDGRTYYGGAWADGEYREPVFPNPLNVRVGEAGVKVWMIVGWLRSHGNDKNAVLERYAPVLKPEDVDAAVAYYESHKAEIDEKLSEETSAA